LNLSIVYGRVCTSTGDVAEHLATQRRNNDEASITDDLPLQANAAMWFIDALCFSSHYAEALAVADDWIARFPKNLPPGDWLSGLNPFAVVVFWQGYALVMTGRLREGIGKLQHSLELGESEGSPEIGAFAMGFAAEAYYLSGEGDSATRCARKMEAITRALGEPAILNAMSKGAFGFAHLAAHRTEDAVESARASRLAYQTIERSTRGWAGLALAEAHLQANEFQTAIEIAQEAIADCRYSLRRDYEARVHGVVALALLRRDGDKARDAVEASLASAAELIDASGAKTIEPHLLEWRAELAAALGDEAQRRILLVQAIKLYEEIGAPMQAERLRGGMT
jgi:tetratricopeptide (TPR) repeat protein